MNDFSVNILGLSKKEHSFNFHLGESFFAKYGTEVVSKGEFDALVVLDKRETLIEASFSINGKANLICDRSLDPFDHPIEIEKKLRIKFGETAEEVSDEIIIIPHDQTWLDVGQFMYEFIVLEIPIKKIHPRFAEEEEDDDLSADLKLIYQSEKSEDDIDPRWEQLKKLK